MRQHRNLLSLCTINPPASEDDIELTIDRLAAAGA
jgi:hypothetical protein